MEQNKTRLSIVTLTITAIVCFIVAILGFVGMPSNSVSATTTVSESTITVDSQAKNNKSVQALNRLPVSEGATKVYVEYVLGNDDAEGHSFMFDNATNTAAVVLTASNSIWTGNHYGQANSHIASANRAALYTANYQITYDLTEKTIVWLRGTTEILKKTDVDYTGALHFGFFSYVNQVGGSFTAKIYDDMGKDLGVTSFDFDNMSIDGLPKVTFNANNGTEASVVEVRGATVAKPTDPTKEGCKFLGWYTDETYTTEYDFSKEVSEDISLYARWFSMENITARTATLSGADDGSRKTVFIKTRLPHSEDATKVFIEYVLTNDNLVDNTASVNALAYPQGAGTWDYKAAGAVNNHIAHTNNGMLYTGSYLITFDLQTNGVTWYRGSTKLELNNPILDTELADVEKFGMLLQPSPVGDVITFKIYDDMGKDLGITTNTSDVVTIEYPEVTFDFNYEGAEDKVVSVEGATVSAENATREGYKFLGWYVDEALTVEYDFAKEVSKDFTLYAKWFSTESITAYNAVLCGANDGERKTVFLQTQLPRSEDATKIYIEYTLKNDNLTGETANVLALAYPQGAGKWDYKSVGAENAHVAAANNGMLYTGSYVITYDLQTNGATWYRGTTQLELASSTFAVELAEMEKFGLMLQPRAVGEVISIKIYDDMGKDLGVTTNTSDTVFITADPVYTVVINANNGASASKQVVVAGETLTATPVYAGHIFKGWFTDAELTTAYDLTQPVSSDLTLYAKWVSIENIAEYNAVLCGANDGERKTVFLQTLLPRSEGATKIYIEYTLVNDNLTGETANVLALAYPQGAGKWEYSSVGAENAHVAAANNGMLYTGSYVITYDLQTNGATWYRGTTQLALASSTFAVELADMEKFGLMLQPRAVNEIISIKIYDDMGKDLGVTTNTSDTVFIAPATEPLYKVAVNANNGENVTEKIVLGGEPLSETIPVYAGHLFKGWFTDAEFTTAYDFSQEVNSDLTLYAKWVSIDHVVARTINLLGEAVESNTKEIEARSRLAVSEGATKVYIEYVLGNDDGEGHSFLFGKSAGTMVGTRTQESVWNGAENFSQENSHVWSVNNAALYTASYTVIFDLVTNKVVWYRGTTVILEGTGNAFADATSFGFWTSTAAGEGSMTIKIYDDMGKDLGVTSANMVNTTVEFPKATFDVNYEGGEDVVVDVTGATISAITDVERPAYKLIGWYTDAECTTAYDFTNEVAGDITVYAKWEEIPQVTVTFNVNGGTEVDPQTINIDTTATAPTTTKTGFDVEGWYLDSELTQKFDFNTAVTEDITLYAKWTVKILTVSFNSNGGSSVDDAKVEYNQAVVAPTAPTKAGGYAFVAWYIDAQLTTEYDFDSLITEDITLYAKWIEATYVVEFNTNGGSAVASQEFKFGGSLTIPTPPTKANHSFMGWYFDADFSRKANFPIVVENNITLYAKWEVVVYTVSFDTDGAGTIEDQKVNSGSTITEPATPVKEGYTFEGWYAEVNGTEKFDFSTAIDANITLYARWKAIPADNTNTDLIGSAMDKLGCSGSIAQDSAIIAGTMLVAVAVIAIKGLKKKED